ncbi:MAG: glycosyltransferase [Deltaproteobacteria bacterium]|jgi:tetratricopeptide (TPR) repeat protein|nr:glycosyltransferase [Deltaproteobacteria bacterium]
MLILSLGSEYFLDAFHKMGHTVVVPPHQDGYPLDSLFNNLRDRPDLIVYTDHLGQHAWPEGLANIYGVPKVYYAVDSPINYWWQKHYARLFDYVFADQKPFARELTSQGIRSSWLPVGVDSKSYLPAEGESADKLFDFGFVGVVDAQSRPKRERLIGLLSQKYTLKSAGGRDASWVGPSESGLIYRQSKLALNENLFPGVTTRMLEAMASGAVLFTEKAGGDLGELFKAGEDFAWFEPPELLEAAATWLGDDKLRAKAAKRSQEKVFQSHDVSHRAETFFQAIEGLHAGFGRAEADSWDDEGQFLFLTALRWPRENGQARIIRAEKLFRRALDGQKISPAGLFTLGHIQRLKGNPQEAQKFLRLSHEAGEPRAALGLGIFHLALQDPVEAASWLQKFALSESFPALALDTLSFEAVKIIAARLLDLGEDACPGFSRAPHDPALWTALEFYQSAFNAQPQDAEAARALAGILFNRGAMSEAMSVAQKGLEHNPSDETLGAIFGEAGRASYLTVN